MSAYQEALAAARKVGAAHCSDPGLMAWFCEHDLQILVGAVSPRLVWEGAQKRGLTAQQLARLATTDVTATADLMW